MRLLLRFFGLLFAAGTIIFVAAVAAAAGLLWHYSQSLPDYSQLQDYEPAVMTRVHASDGSLLAEYARERRLYIPIQAVSKLVIHAFVAAEDKNFYEHGGIDFSGIARAATLYIQQYGSGRRPQGASTITQQVAKNFLLTNELSFARKIKEALLAMKIERAFSKERILELYLNEIYLGMGAYGVAAASLLYFDKSVHELSVAEAAYLAALPKAPNNYHPFRQRERALERRNYVLDRMAEDHYITAQEAEKAKKEPLKITPRPTGAHIFAAEYFAEEVRRYIYDNFTEKKLYEGGLSVRATLDPKMQVLARKVLVDGFVNFDEQHGYRGAAQKIDPTGDWGAKLAEVKALSDVAPWRLAVVLEADDAAARVGLQPGREPGGALSKERETGTIALEGMKWAKARGKTPTKVSQVLSPGDVVYVEPLGGGQFRLRQVPEVSGAIVAMDPQTGRVLAMAGGFSYDQSQFNRATQALRQPGSSFKPLVYAAALDNGYTPSTVVLDAPIEIDTGTGIWAPENYTRKYYGPSTLRFGIEQSRNVMTVRLAQDIGMPLIGEYAKRFGVYDNLPPYLSFALGAGETTLLRMVGAYAMFDNGGRKIQPTLIDRIQDRYGHTIYKHDSRECRGCDADKWADQNEPTLIDKRERVLDPMTAYQITSIMEGVVQRGTATVVKEVGKPIAGKTGTTNDEKDAWFIGFSPDLVVGVYLGYDKPRHLGRGATGGVLAAPIVRDFMKVALADKPAVPFRVPPGIKLIR
ncbi:MAG: penicillin-binding protein 1A, partial [Hyphomicrobiales bacterium]|nr:penicillin-binding protein 1A [Hyphomicrobiales bacterium]